MISQIKNVLLFMMLTFSPNFLQTTPKSKCEKCYFDGLQGEMSFDLCKTRDGFLLTYKELANNKNSGNRTVINNFLFRGPSGSGKTTAAKLFAKSIGAKLIHIEALCKVKTDYPKKVFIAIDNAYKEADEFYKKTGQPVVILIDNVDEFAGEPQCDNGNLYQATMRHMNDKLQERQYRQHHIISILTTNYDNIHPTTLKRCSTIFFTLPTSSDRAEILKHYLKGYPHELTENVLSLLVQFTAGFAGGDIEFGVSEAIKLAKEQKSKNLEFAHLIEGLLHAIEKNERLSKTKVKDRALRKELMKFYAAKEEQSFEEFAQNLFARLTFNFSKNDVECMVSYASALAQSEGTSINVSHLIRGFLHALQLNSRLGAIYSTQAAAVTIGSLVAAYLAYKGIILAPAVIKNIMDKLGKVKPTQETQGASAITSTTSATSATGSKPASTAKK